MGDAITALKRSVSERTEPGAHPGATGSCWHLTTNPPEATEHDGNLAFHCPWFFDDREKKKTEKETNY